MPGRDKWLLTGFAAVIFGIPLMLLVWTMGQHGLGPFAKGVDEASYDDLRTLDADARELGEQMARPLGPADDHAARALQKGSGVEVLVSRGTSSTSTAEVILRLTTEHWPDSFFSSSQPEGTTVSVCYRWVFGDSYDDEEPERLDDCPPGPALSAAPTMDLSDGSQP